MTEYTFYVCVNDAEHEVTVEENDRSNALRKCKEILGVQPDDEFEILEIQIDSLKRGAEK